MGAIAATLYRAPNIRAALAQVGPGWQNLHPYVQSRAVSVIEESARVFAPKGLRVGMYEGWRDINTQKKRMQGGVSWVGDALNSYHPWGLAVDFVFIDRLGRWTWLPDPQNPQNTRYVDPRWYTLGEIIERDGFEWGGRWQNFDGPHAQLPVKKIAALKSTYGTPDKFIGTFA